MAQRTLKIEGMKFGLLTVLCRADDYRLSKKWSCECECGNIHNTTYQRLKNGSTKSCGCAKSELISKSLTKHGGYKDGKNTPEYQSFIAMLHRCYDDKRDGWENYGARGITVEEHSWLEPSPNGYLNFIKDMGDRPDGTSLDRVDVNLGYSKENCRWADRRTQAYNSRRPKKANSTSKYRGVSLGNSERNPWVARIGDGLGGYTWLGQFSSQEQAALAYNQAAIEIHGDGAILNIIENEDFE